MSQNSSELYCKWRLQPGRMTDFLSIASQLVNREIAASDGTLRCDWFANEGNNEVITMAVYRDAAGVASHGSRCAELYGELMQMATPALQWIGRPSHDALAALPWSAAIADFDRGLATVGGANQFRREKGGEPVPHIEIYTRFAIQPGKLLEFRKLARECLSAVIAHDPGTLRYDWFYDEAGLVSLALDTYADPQAMFAHMKNCSAPHHELLRRSQMTTEFLGPLSVDAYAAIAKYNPYVARFVAGLKPYSSGGFR